MYRNSIDDSITYYDKNTATNFIGVRSHNKPFKRLETADTQSNPMATTFLKEGVTTAHQVRRYVESQTDSIDNDKDSLLQDTVGSEFHSLKKASKTSQNYRIKFRPTKTANPVKVAIGRRNLFEHLSPQNKFIDNFS